MKYCVHRTKQFVMLLPYFIVSSILNFLEISLKCRRNNFLVDAGTGLSQILQSRVDNSEANQAGF